MLQIGVIALQGDFSRHIAALKRCDCNALEVRTPQDLDNCEAVIIPGGESTVMAKLMEKNGLKQKLISFGQKHPIFGTCAGAILLASEVKPATFLPLNLIDISVERNFYGRQDSSFFSEIVFDAPTDQDKNMRRTIPGYFIRAPRIVECGHKVTILGHMQGDAVLVQQGFHLAATFHSELTSNLTLHHYFLELVKKSKQ